MSLTSQHDSGSQSSHTAAYNGEVFIFHLIIFTGKLTISVTQQSLSINSHMMKTPGSVDRSLPRQESYKKGSNGGASKNRDQLAFFTMLSDIRTD